MQRTPTCFLLRMGSLISPHFECRKRKLLYSHGRPFTLSSHQRDIKLTLIFRLHALSKVPLSSLTRQILSLAEVSSWQCSQIDMTIAGSSAKCCWMIIVCDKFFLAFRPPIPGCSFNILEDGCIFAISLLWSQPHIKLLWTHVLKGWRTIWNKHCLHSFSFGCTYSHKHVKQMAQMFW